MSKVNIIYNGPEHSDIEEGKVKSANLAIKKVTKTPKYNKSVPVSTSGTNVSEQILRKTPTEKNITVDVPNQGNVTQLKIKTLYNQSDKNLRNVHPRLESSKFNNIRNPKLVQNEDSVVMNSILPETVEHLHNKRNYKLTPESIFINKKELVNNGQVNKVYSNTYNTSSKKGKNMYDPADNFVTDVDLRPKFSNNKMNSYTEYGPSEIKIKVVKAVGDLPEPRHIQRLELM